MSISIHLMLLFNIFDMKPMKIHIYFNTSNVTIQQPHTIYCMFHPVYFNTSNVTIQLWHLRLFCTSIMYFNTSNVTIQHRITYLNRQLLVISIHLMLLFNGVCNYLLQAIYHFNTSNVTIQQVNIYYCITTLNDFNTSNVTIQQNRKRF